MATLVRSTSLVVVVVVSVVVSAAAAAADTHVHVAVTASVVADEFLCFAADDFHLAQQHG